MMKYCLNPRLLLLLVFGHRWLTDPIWLRSFSRLICGCLLLTLIGFPVRGDQLSDQPAEWAFWRGPEQNGVSREKNLPGDWSPQGQNLVWRNTDYGTRCTPIAMNGKLYFICRHKAETTEEAEKVVCLDAATGEMLWESIHNLFLSDAPAERVGWAPCVGDPTTGYVYALGIGCKLKCLDGETGQIIWERSMLEEYGMLSTYGGRTNYPQLYENMLIVSGVMTQWGEHAVPAHRFLALDKLTGEAIWFTSTVPRPEDTTYSTPVFTTFNGQAAMVVGAADGALYAMQPRTGKTIWRYQASPRGFNTTPLIIEDRVFCAFGEKSFADTTILGGAFALNGVATGTIPEQDLLWKIDGKIINRSSPIYANGYVYMVDDGAGVMAIDPETGKIVKQQKVGRIMFGSLLYADNKIYCGESTGNFWIFEPQPDGSLKQLSRVRLNNEEIFSSPIAYRGRVYFSTTEALYCLGQPDVSVAAEPLPASRAEAPLEDRTVAHLQIVPVESLLAPDERIEFRVEGFNSIGQSLGIVPAKLTLVGSGTLTGNTYQAPSSGHHAIRVTAELDQLTSTGRVRIVPPLPWAFDFENGQVPPTWIGADYRHQPAEFEGEKCLVKIQTIPKGTRSQLWMGPWHLSDYTVEADVYSTGGGENIADMGIVNQRYTLDLMAKQQLQIRSWTPRLELRFARTIPYPWQANQWYTLKFQSENNAEGVTLRGKVWKRGEPEPDQWDIEATDKTPNQMGSPGLFGNSFLAPFYIDNVKVYPN
jgi:outer membrane protein assembly factor BamB